MKFLLPRGIEQILDSVEVEKESVAAAAGEERVGARLDDVGLGAEGDLGVGDDLRPDSFGRARFRAFRHEYVDGLLAVLRLRKHVADRDVRQAIAVVVDVEAVDGVGMERVGIRICVEDDHGSSLDQWATGTRRDRRGRVFDRRAAGRGSSR